MYKPASEEKRSGEGDDGETHSDRFLMGNRGVS